MATAFEKDLGHESDRSWQREAVAITPSIARGELEAAGLFDPSAPDADHRLYLLTVILERGGTLEQMISAAAHGRLARLAAELLFVPSPDRFTVGEAAAKTAVDVERIQALWRAAGFPELPNDDPRLTPAELEMITTFDLGAALFGEPATTQLLRVVASSMSRIADATVSTFIATAGVEAASDPSRAQLAQANTAAAALYPRLLEAIDAILRQQLVEQSRHGDAGVASGYELRTLAVGFIDVVGSTALALHTSLGDIGIAMQRFDTQAAETVTSRGGRVVKFIGDEVMYQVADPAAACEIALDIVAACGDDDILPGARAGVAHGDVLVRDGDCFGPVINLAARLTKAARPHTVLVSSQLARAATSDTLRFTPLPPERVKGFDDPVQLALVEH